MSNNKVDSVETTVFSFDYFPLNGTPPMFSVIVEFSDYDIVDKRFLYIILFSVWFESRRKVFDSCGCSFASKDCLLSYH